MWDMRDDNYSLKWLLIPAGFLLYMLIKMDIGKSKCTDACKLKGFEHIRYQPERNSRYDHTPEHCICLTEEESQIKKRIPKGLRLY